MEEEENLLVDVIFRNINREYVANKDNTTHQKSLRSTHMLRGKCGRQTV